MNIRIGSRGSDLALWQARHVASHLDVQTDIVIIRTRGDEVQHLSLDKVEGKGFFTKEIEAALLARQVDVAVHSYKDLPTEAVPGLSIAAVPERAPVEDVLIIRLDAAGGGERWGLRRGARVGTSSLRRKAQLLGLRPDLMLADLRGNVPTRLRKVEAGELDAVVLARAGVSRLGLLDGLEVRGMRAVVLGVDEVCPAPAQGALAVQVRTADEPARRAIARLHDADTATAVDAERALLSRFGGGCHLPLGAYCVRDAQGFTLVGLVASPDGRERLHARAQGPSTAELVESVHASLVRQGAQRYV